MTFTKIPENEAGDYIDQWADGPGCDASDNTSHGFVCTRSRGHVGPHIAHTMPNHAIAKWGGLDDTDLELDTGL